MVFHLIRNAHMNVDELDTLFNKRSGMMGMTGFGDLREVHRLVAEGNEDAKLALDVYVHRIVSYIGNYTYQMGGCDVITFTAGVGENDDIVRKMVCDKLAPVRRQAGRGEERDALQGAAHHLHPGLLRDHRRHPDERGAGHRPQVRRNRRERRGHLRQHVHQVTNCR